jgi:hypothetical protein
MNRPLHFNYIVSKLASLATEIDLRGKLNLLDLHVHAENFYQHLFNELFGWELENLNAIKPNAAAIDLIDHTNNIVVQVSATATKQKVESALGKADLSPYAGYGFKFISISKDAAALRSTTFANPHNLTFDPQADIHDVATILRHITGLPVDDQRRIVALIKKELGTEVDPVRLESNLATIINILAKEEWSRESSVRPIPFDIDQKIGFNDLKDARYIIYEYNLHHSRVTRIYADYDREGNNKSMSVLDTIKRLYVSHKARLGNDALFFWIIECVAERVQGSPNFTPIPIEELELSVNILVVDAFIRCKIFENPEGYAHAAA